MPGARDLALLYADFDNGYDAFAIDNSFATLSDRPGRDAQRSTGASLDLACAARWRRRAALDHGRADSDIVASFDGDWGNDSDWGEAGPYDFFSETRRNRRTLSEDLRITAPAGAIGWIAGLWLQRLEEDNRIADDGRYLEDAFVRLLDSRYRATSAALYGQADVALTPATTLTIGLRASSAMRATLTATASRSPRATACGAASSARRIGSSAARTSGPRSRAAFAPAASTSAPSVPEDRQQFNGGVPLVGGGRVERAQTRRAACGPT